VRTKRRRSTKTPERLRHEKEVCMDYLRRAGSLPAARRLAKKDGITYNTSMWIGALSELFGRFAAGTEKEKE
jgi:hypothetical protein